jgi:hypothetical protein
MNRMAAIILFSAVLALGSCNDCTDCTPFTEEPFLKIRFFNGADNTKRIIIIDSVNQVGVSGFKHFTDTTYEFKFPLDMHHDTSVFQMIYRDTSDLVTPLKNNITVIYRRNFLRREDNYLIVEANLDSLTADFSKFELICKSESNTECLSNEAVANLYN